MQRITHSGDEFSSSDGFMESATGLMATAITIFVCVVPGDSMQ